MADVETVRPNIRVEIQNNLAGEAMEVDDESRLLKSDEEEGEINDEDDELDSFTIRPRQTSASLDQDPPASYFNKVSLSQKDAFTTGINIFDKQEQEKRLERAKRFALKPDEICSFTDADLSLLYASLGIAPDRPDVRFEAVHMLGTKDMNAEDILEYFSKYAPTSIEWVDDNSCNIVWIESISAARALHFNSKVIRGMPVRAPIVDPFPTDFLDPSVTENDITLSNENREIELATEPKARDVELVDEVKEREVELRDEDSVDVSEITAPIPPGYWRLGKGSLKSKCILLRFAFKTDKQAFRTETFSKYYKKIGNVKGAPIDPRKNGRSIFERNKHLQPAQDKNPWGVLAKNWDEDAQFREKERRGEDFFEHKNPNIQKRLGLKRKVESESDNDVEIIENNENSQKVNRAKFPRMRMYADEEEELVRRKKLLKNLKMQAEKISKQSNSNSDLRNVLALTNHRLVVGETDMRADLGNRLRNRRSNILYSVEQEAEEEEEDEEEEPQHQREVSALLQITKHFEAPSRLERTPERRMGRMRADEEESRERERRTKLRLQAESNRDREREHRSRRSSHSSHLRSDRERKRYERSDDYEQKPRSKVSVVVRQNKVPTVASRVWPRVDRRSSSSSGSNSESSDESESSESESESEESSSSSSSSESSRSEEDQRRKKRRMKRPGFSGPERVKVKDERRSPLKIEISNDHFKRK